MLGSYPLRIGPSGGGRGQRAGGVGALPGRGREAPGFSSFSLWKARIVLHLEPELRMSALQKEEVGLCLRVQD